MLSRHGIVKQVGDPLQPAFPEGGCHTQEEEEFIECLIYYGQPRFTQTTSTPWLQQTARSSPFRSNKTRINNKLGSVDGGEERNTQEATWLNLGTKRSHCLHTETLVREAESLGPRRVQSLLVFVTSNSGMCLLYILAALKLQENETRHKARGRKQK